MNLEVGNGGFLDLDMTFGRYLTGIPKYKLLRTPRRDVLKVPLSPDIPGMPFLPLEMTSRPVSLPNMPDISRQMLF